MLEVSLIDRLYLASTSPRRSKILTSLGVAFKTLTPEVDESMPKDLSPEELVIHLSRTKAESVMDRVKPGDILVAADTIVVLDGAPLGKPEDEQDAFHMLATLSGVWHQVYTGLTVTRGDDMYSETEMTEVKFRELTSNEIETYIETGEPLDKAGAYGIQGRGALFVERIEGDYFNVVGLPVCKLGAMLNLVGFNLLTGELGD
ncbi:Maf family protein [Oscillospiraceae bacterium OttesenSCG-928-G22]|nr:Maf family protein [Oscillospiraceae bacterium OttesenSCG-928-G22]